MRVCQGGGRQTVELASIEKRVGRLKVGEGEARCLSNLNKE